MNVRLYIAVSLILCLAASVLLITAQRGAAQVEQITSSEAILSNELVQVRVDLHTGLYDILDARSGRPLIRNAAFEVERISSADSRGMCSASAASIQDELGMGRALTVICGPADGPGILAEFRLYPMQSFVVLRAGLRNNSQDSIRIKQMVPMAKAEIYPGIPMSDPRLLNAPSGANQTRVVAGIYGTSPNNLLFTFGHSADRHTVMLGALKTADFVPRASLLPQVLGGRMKDISAPWAGARLVGYLDCGQEDASPPQELFMVAARGNPYSFRTDIAQDPIKSISYENNRVEIHAHGLKPDKNYVLGFSWWDYNSIQRRESVVAMDRDGNETPLIPAKDLPQYIALGEMPVEQAVLLRPETYSTGNLRVAFKNDALDVERTPNAVVSEAWLWEVEPETQIPSDWLSGRIVPWDVSSGPAYAELRGSDPVGRMVDSGQTYMPEDSYYIDFGEADPFKASEVYGQRLRLATHANPNPYEFPTVCAWWISQTHIPESQDPENDYYRINNTEGLVEEAEWIARSGFLNYSRAAARLVPDSYTPDNAQGWWDDEHWSKYGHYSSLYNTSQKWGSAMQAFGVLAFTYFQPTCFQSGTLISRDFRLLHPDMMLSHDSSNTLDYTNPQAQAHMLQVYSAMRGAISGIMFDYPDDLWNLEANNGGFEDPYATGTSFYRHCFRLARSGMGPDFWIHERALYSPGADLTLGITDSQRTSGDTINIDPAMIARSGLRWYKNRVVIGYDMDAKDLFSAWKSSSYQGSDEDGRRMVLTMAYVAASRLLLPNSFREFTPEVLHDLERTFPYHTAPKSARPLDAFVSDGWPSVYDFDISAGWHQVTLLNNTDPSKEKTISVPMSGDSAEGALGLNPNKKYHVYDFWNDRYVDKLEGSGVLSQTLRPGEARMLSVHEVEPNPQFLSTNRHIMQGYLDLVQYPVWNGRLATLTGSASVVGNEQYEIVLALNGFVPKSVSAGCNLSVSSDGKLAILSIDSPDNDVVPWQVIFAKPSSRTREAVGRGR